MIMEMTRNKSTEDKRLIRSFCDKLLFNKKLEETRLKNEEIIPSLIEYHLTNIDPQKIVAVKKLKFKVKQ